MFSDNEGFLGIVKCPISWKVCIMFCNVSRKFIVNKKAVASSYSVMTYSSRVSDKLVHLGSNDRHHLHQRIGAFLLTICGMMMLKSWDCYLFFSHDEINAMSLPPSLPPSPSLPPLTPNPHSIGRMSTWSCREGQNRFGWLASRSSWMYENTLMYICSCVYACILISPWLLLIETRFLISSRAAQ